MKRSFIALAAVVCLVLSTSLFSQSNNGTVSGTVSDVSQALVPGVTFTATNNETGVVTSGISNEAGAYTLVGLQPGRYKISASLPGFRTQTYADVQVGNAAQVRLNFKLEVATVTTQVEVTISAQNLITSSSSSVGEVLPQQQVQDLPLVSNNVLDLVGVMAGVFMTNDAVFGAEQTNFAGVSARDINVQRDGVSLNSQRWPNGLDAPTRMNPDLVGEVKLILAPVDAEMGRGNGQVQIQTRSGTNAFHGSAVWNVQNSALDSNLWSNNRAVPRIIPQWRNLQEYTVAFGGPIKKNKSFFYVLWDQQIALQRRTAFPTVLTDCARLGIFRYFDGFNNGPSNQIPVVSGGTSTVPVVDVNGAPKSPDGSPLRFLSVFGPLAANPTKNDCSDAQINTTTLVPTGASSWDPFRTQLDPTGYMRTNLDVMPRANAFDNPGNLTATSGFFATYAPDGLNTATARWNQYAKGADNLFGVGQDNNRRQINVKLDHNFNQSHKVSGSYSYEIDTSDDAALPPWPGIPNGVDIRKPQVLAVNFTSTLNSSLVNEARIGLARSGANTGGALDRDDVGAEWLAKLPQINGEALSTNVGFQNMAFGFGYAGSLQYASHEVSPRWSYGDTVSWARGAHSFKFGAEYRSARTKSRNGGTVQGGSFRPTASIGNAPLAGVGGIARPGLAGSPGAFGSGNTVIAENLLTWLSGSLSSLQQGRFINELKPEWNDPLKEPFKIRDIYQNEIGTFVKDDWKISQRLTLNLGLRWDYYGVPWEKSGLTTGLTGGGMALFGVSGRGFDGWMKPGERSPLTEIIYVGPNSPNPDQSIYKKEWNNFGPAIGFAWQVPWFGEGKTTVRGGYQLQYLGGGRGFVLDTAIGNPPGSSNTASYIIPASDPYFSIAKLNALPNAIPVAPTFLPSPTSTIIPVTDRTGLMNAFDPNFLSPYVQNMTLSVTRNVTQKVTLDFKYIGTLTRKLYTNLDLNSPNFLFNGLKEAFDAARSGGESQLLDNMFDGLTITQGFLGDTCRLPGTATAPGAVTPCGAVGSINSDGVKVTGAMALRAFNGTRSNLANGNYVGLATTLNTLTNAGAGTTGSSGSLSGSVLRHANSLYPGQFPENFIKANPQMSTAVLEGNFGHANYHSFQSQVSLRPTAGVSLQATYTFSRNLGQAPGEGPNGTGAIYTEPYNRGADYALLGNHRAHTLVTYGSFALPVGPGKNFFGNSSGFWARLAENWQASWIVNLASGAPTSIAANPMLYGLGTPDIVGQFDSKEYLKSWANGGRSGNVFSDGNGNPLYSKVRDPQCLNRTFVNADLGAAGTCTLNGIANASGQVVLQTPLPGKRGTLGQRTVEALGTWSTDMAIQKKVKLTESKSMTVRLDATNIFNHPTPAIGGGFFAATSGVPDLNMQSAVPFGDLNSKVGNREFQLKARLDF